MIRYALRCAEGHEFEQWFNNMADYDQRQPELSCPECGSPKVSKAIMAPNVGKSRSQPAPPPSCGQAPCGAGHCPMMAGG